MKNGFLKLALVSPAISIADPAYNADLCVNAAREAAENGAKVVLFPELVLSGATAGDLFYQSTLIDKCRAALMKYKEETAKLDIISFIGFPLRYGSKLYDAVAAVSRGEILGISTRAPMASERYFSSFGDAEYVSFSEISRIS